jgi:hypothetical protein
MFNGASESFQFDTACYKFMSPHRHHFYTYTAVTDGEEVLTGNGYSRTIGVGSIKVKSFTGSEWIELFLNDVLHLPTLPAPLFSEPACQPQILN